MKLILTKDDGTVIETWYLPSEDIASSEVIEKIEDHLPTYLDRRDYEHMSGLFEARESPNRED